MKYLIVEDDPNLRLLWNTVLTGQGYDVTEADTLEGARQAMQSVAFDAMVLDLYLGRENALSLAALAFEICPGCKVIIVTGAAELRESEIMAVSKSVVSVHRKPVDIEDLLDACLRLDHRAASQASL